MGFGLVAAVDGCAPWAVRCLWVYWKTASEKVPNGEDMDVWRMVMLCQNVVRKWAKCECVKFQIINI